ncbi:MAG: PHB depolymerase family esterase, partial [Gammaproteobacteria bacterium]|nr:PHB depolymerase family esterase [Gammaproteobacteria bacterium]
VVCLTAFTATVNAELLPLEDFGDNPGELTAFYYQPDKPTRSLVVLLHGCGQDARKFAKDSGFQDAAEQSGFALLIPQQQKANNLQLCFNWFSPADYSLNQGESRSILSMIENIKTKLGTTKTYLAGFSAGGAMVSSLLSLQPSNYESGAIIAGVVFPCADTLLKAISCMKNGAQESTDELARQIIQQNNNKDQWPSLHLIAGKNDPIVNPVNSNQLAKQWGVILSTEDSVTENIGGIEKTIKRNKQTQKYVELIVIKDLGHGWPVNPEVKFGGKVAPFVLKSPLSTVDHLLKSWQLNK